MKKKKSEIQIFLAHASEDKPAVLNLYERLKGEGYKPWLDRKDLIGGQIWKTEIPKAINKSEIFIACLSSNSFVRRGYFQKELRIALDIFAEMPPETIYLIPLKLEEFEIPDLQLSEGGLNLRDIHWIDCWEADAFEQIERAIAHQFSIEPEKPEPPLIVTPSTPKLTVFKFELVAINARGEAIKKEPKQAEYFAEDLGNGITLDMVAIPGGKFLMGTEDEEIERLVKKYDWEGFRREKPQHEVTIQPFFMGKYPITQAQWKAIASRSDLQVERKLDLNPAYFKGDERPVEQVSWYDAVEFCARLTKLTRREYRLPSEAQWEYSCRSVISYQLSVTSEESSQNNSPRPVGEGQGVRAYPPFYFGETITGDLANYNASYTYADEPAGQYRQKTTPVGQFPPNSFGLYDMHGTVWEWCEDDWHDNYKDAPKDGRAWLEENGTHNKLLRGGCWTFNPRNCRSAFRYNFTRESRSNDIGFRVCCVLPRTLLST